MGCFETKPELKEIVELVTGSESAWARLASESNCWYEHFPGYLFYAHPSCTFYELSTLAEKWLNRWLSERGSGGIDRDDANLKHLDHIVLKIMQNDFHQVLRDIQNVYDQQWFATHLTDLLWHSGKLNMFNDDSNEYVNKIFFVCKPNQWSEFIQFFLFLLMTFAFVTDSVQIFVNRCCLTLVLC